MKENTNTENIKRKERAVERKDERKGKRDTNVWSRLFLLLGV